MSNRFSAYFKRIAAVVTVAAIVLLTVPATSASASASPEWETGFGKDVFLAPVEEGEEIVDVEMPNVNYGSAIVMDADTGAVLYEKHAYLQRPMASTTKIMTCLLALESGDIGRTVIIDQDMLAYDEEGSTKLGLKLGDQITIHDLVVGMLLLSGNDCAQAVAIDLGGSFDGFASLMNERASEIGMFDTHFVTPSGLDAVGHYSTAYDMALLGAEAMKNDYFAELCGLRSYQVKFGNPPSNYPLNTHNYLIEGQSHGVKGCNGIKTGYTDNAGYCLVSHVERDGVSLVCCTLGAPSYWSYHEELYDYAFSKYVKLQAVPQMDQIELKVIGGASRTVDVYCYIDGTFSVHENQIDGVYSKVTINNFEYAPITKDQVVGQVTYYYGSAPLATYSIRAAENVECVTSDWLSAYIDAIKYDMETDAAG